jgi:hypothetical protein
MKKIYVLALFLAIGSVGYSQKTTLKLTSFNGVDAFGPFEIELIKSEIEYIEIDYRGIDKEKVISEVQRGVVKLKLKTSHFFSDWDEHEYRKSEYVLVKVYYKDIDIIEAQAGALVTSRERLKSKYLTIESSMGAEVTLDVIVKEINTKTTMGGILDISGQAEKLEAYANMGGVLKASHLESKIVFVKATMGADVIVNVIDELEASAGFGAVIDYVGGPSVRHTNKSMGGEVHRRGN